MARKKEKRTKHTSKQWQMSNKTNARLVEGCTAGDVEKVKRCFQEGANVNHMYCLFFIFSAKSLRGSPCHGNSGELFVIPSIFAFLSLFRYATADVPVNCHLCSDFSLLIVVNVRRLVETLSGGIPT